MGKKPAGFKWRSFSSFGLAFSFLFILVTGVVLYFAPAGRVSRWIGWEFSGFNLTAWEALHTIFSYVFIGFALVHLLVFNWKAFYNYLKKRSKKGIHRRRELFWAGLVTIIIFFGTLFHIPPFGSVMDFGYFLSGKWGSKTVPAPFPHTEKLTLTELSERIPFLFVHDAIQRLEDAGISVENSEQTLGDIGAVNSLAPVEVYIILMGDSLLATGFTKPADLTVREYAGSLEISSDELLLILKNSGIVPREDEFFRDLAKRYQTTPERLVCLVKEELRK